LDSLARDVERVESIRTIKDIQRSFSQLAQFGRYDDMAALFSRNGTLVWGNATAKGLAAIEVWLRTDAGDMNGKQPGSIDTIIAENPLVSLSVDGRSAKARWNGLRFQGDGEGGTRIQGGVYENEYVFSGGKWKISMLHYYALYAGPYIGGWRNVGGLLPFVPYHFTPESSGIPIPVPEGQAQATNATVQELVSRIQRLNDEDEVRNLMHARGYYIDRRMWSDVVDLHTSNTTVTLLGTGTYIGLSGVRQSLERFQGPEGLTQGINNDHPIFDMIIDVNTNGVDAVARGIEIAMLGDANTRAASWEFNVFRNHLTKDNGVWKVKAVHVTPLIVADYYLGWGYGGLKSPNTYVPPFIKATQLSFGGIKTPRRGTNTDLADLQRRLGRSAAYDGAENQSHAYGFVIDDLDCGKMGALFAKRGHKANPFAGYFISPERTATACYTTYGYNRTALRSSISFHWRPQPVILVSEDGRSATLRARLLQPSTNLNRSGSFNNAIYHDQMVLEDGKWRLWSVTIDEFYWQSTSWEGGWSAANPRNKSEPDPPPADWIKKYPPDITLKDIGERESTFRGGSGGYIQWPEIQRMWFQYRNLASGRVPEFYWPGCVPCKAKPDWALEANGYQEPPTGP
ncbi:hypothetical protein K504DRAFT_355318, partial [Pleomassaria siparia CBS 279.74]